MSFKETNIEELQFNPFTKIGKQWMLLTAGDELKCNTMTASWGGVGIMWGKNVVTAYIRPQRFTKEFVDANECFTISFLPKQYREALNICGSVSGRDVGDKWEKSGLHPYFTDDTAAVEEAELVFICRTLYRQELLPECFLDEKCDTDNYPINDYHDMYIAEITKVLVKE